MTRVTRGAQIAMFVARRRRDEDVRRQTDDEIRAEIHDALRDFGIPVAPVGRFASLEDLEWREGLGPLSVGVPHGPIEVPSDTAEFDPPRTRAWYLSVEACSEARRAASWQTRTGPGKEAPGHD